MNVPSKDIANYLESTSSLDLELGVNLFVGSSPSSPDNVVIIKDTPGGIPEKDFQGASGFYRPSIQIKVRNNNYQTAWGLINDIKNTLDGLNSIVINSTKYIYINCIVEPFFFIRR